MSLQGELHQSWRNVIFAALEIYIKGMSFFLSVANYVEYMNYFVYIIAAKYNNPTKSETRNQRRSSAFQSY